MLASRQHHPTRIEPPNPWERVESGLTLMIGEIAVVSVATLVLAPLMAAGVPGAVYLWWVAMVFACGLGTVGFIRLAATPEESGARKLITVSVILFALWILLGPISQVFGKPVEAWIYALEEVCLIGYWVVLLFWTREIGRYLADEDLRESAMGLLKFWTAGMILFSLAEWLPRGCIVLLIPLCIVLQFRYVGLLYRARDAVRTAPPPPGFARPRMARRPDVAV